MLVAVQGKPPIFAMLCIFAISFASVFSNRMFIGQPARNHLLQVD